MSKCIYCDRPLKRGQAICQQDERQLAKAKTAAKAKQPEAFKYVHYRGHVVAFRKNGGATLKPAYIGMSLARVPKDKLIDLDIFCKGYDKEQIKRLRACVMRLAGIKGDIPRDWRDQPPEQKQAVKLDPRVTILA